MVATASSWVSAVGQNRTYREMTIFDQPRHYWFWSVPCGPWLCGATYAFKFGAFAAVVAAKQRFRFVTSEEWHRQETLEGFWGILWTFSAFLMNWLFIIGRLAYMAKSFDGFPFVPVFVGQRLAATAFVAQLRLLSSATWLSVRELSRDFALQPERNFAVETSWKVSWAPCELSVLFLWNVLFIIGGLVCMAKIFDGFPFVPVFVVFRLVSCHGTNARYAHVWPWVFLENECAPGTTLTGNSQTDTQIRHKYTPNWSQTSFLHL